ncbi:ECF transporter S component [Oscillospiraceae bacterium PP1C4]
MPEVFFSKRTRAAAWVIVTALPALLVAYTYFVTHRSAIPPIKERSFWDQMIANSDIILALIFLLVSTIPFFLVFDHRKPQARELIPIAVMAALCVVGRAAFSIIPLPHFKPVSAIIIITAVAFGPETGFLTGALAGFVSNFMFGQGPWTPWQMFCWGMIGFIAGLLQNGNYFRDSANNCYFQSDFWDRLCPAGTNRGDLLLFARSISGHASMRLCLYGLCTGFGYGWVMNLYFIIGYVNPITWQTVGAAYLSSFFFDLSHGVCTFLVLWALAEPWTHKLERIKVKFGLVGEERNYHMPPAAEREI